MLFGRERRSSIRLSIVVDCREKLSEKTFPRVQKVPLFSKRTIKLAQTSPPAVHKDSLYWRATLLINYWGRRQNSRSAPLTTTMTCSQGDHLHKLVCKFYRAGAVVEAPRNFQAEDPKDCNFWFASLGIEDLQIENNLNIHILPRIDFSTWNQAINHFLSNTFPLEFCEALRKVAAATEPVSSPEKTSQISNLTIRMNLINE